MRFAYADPPYLGCAAKHYGDHPDHEVYDTVAGHRQLVDRLMAEYDGWAYSMTSTTIADLAPIMPRAARWAAWVKPFASFKPNVNPAYVWEPVVFYGGRKRTRDALTVRDWIAEPITMRREFIGAKPHAFVVWMLDLLGAQPEDTIDDLFPGSGAVTAAIERWRNERPLPLEVAR